ncbi:MAG: peptide transporter [Butyrivibrio sp.]|nr:peptide transporter [Butyrivibrio sp.]
MSSFIRLTDYKKEELQEIFDIADNIDSYEGFLNGKTVVMFFPANSIRTRVSFEKGIHLLGGQTILFDPSTLDKKEDIRDVCGYLENWADAVIVRHKDIGKLAQMSANLDVPVINAMTDDNHPCEMMSDLYSLSQIRKDYLSDKYLFVGADGNIGRAWKEASEAFGFSLVQCCPGELQKLRIFNTDCIDDLRIAIVGKDIVCTDSFPPEMLNGAKSYQVTKEIMNLANAGAVLNPCPPFYRGEEVSEDVIDSEYFVGYEFKKNLLRVQQAIIVFCMKK